MGEGEEHGSAVLIAMTTHPTSLIGTHVRLDLLTVGDAAAIDAASTGPRDTFLYAPVPGADPALPGARDGHAAIVERLSTYAAGTWIPFVQRRMSDGAVVGMTNYIAIGERLTGEAAPSGVEIGGTWLSPDAQRSPINTEAKLLLLRFAFEEWKVSRVQIKTDERNERSRSAILRLGATFEGILRNFQPGSGDVGYGSPRNTAMYSIIDTEWPSVKTRLEAYLA